MGLGEGYSSPQGRPEAGSYLFGLSGAEQYLQHL